MHPSQINEAKEKGNKAWVQNDLSEALTHYMKALKYAEVYDNDTRDSLPYKDNFGKLEKLQEGQMYHQDFQRLKAILFNNVSSCFFKYGNMEQAEKYNDMSIIQDPDYGKAHFRKCTILEKKAQFTQAAELAQYYQEEYEHEMEMDQANKDMAARFKEIVDRCLPRVGEDTVSRQERLKKEVEEEMQNGYLSHIEQMLDDEDFFVDDDEDEEDDKPENVPQNPPKPNDKGQNNGSDSGSDGHDNLKTAKVIDVVVDDRPSGEVQGKGVSVHVDREDQQID